MADGSGGAAPRNGSEGRTPPRERWWFTATLYGVAGFAVAAYQWGPIANGTADWLNWLVAAVGVALVAVSARALIVSRPRG